MPAPCAAAPRPATAALMQAQSARPAVVSVAPTCRRASRPTPSSRARASSSPDASATGHPIMMQSNSRSQCEARLDRTARSSASTHRAGATISIAPKCRLPCASWCGNTFPTSRATKVEVGVAREELDSLTIEAFAERAASIETELRKAIVGQRDVVRQVLIALFAGGHVLLEGVPGLGKTLLVRTLGDVLSLRFSRIQFTPDLMPADIVGTAIVSEDLDGRRSMRFQAGPIFANLVLADEINRATPKTQSALLEAMQEQTVSAGDATRPLPRRFFVLATQNPLEMEGTYPLPEAQLDRFMFKVNVKFPSATELVAILGRTTGGDGGHATQVADGQRILAMGALARKVPIPTHVSDYVARLTIASHPDSESATD